MLVHSVLCNKMSFICIQGAEMDISLAPSDDLQVDGIRVTIYLFYGSSWFYAFLQFKFFKFEGG